MIAVVGAGAMGAALAIVHARAGAGTVLLGTSYDDATVEACRSGRPHPALGIVVGVECRPYEDWSDVLPQARRVVVAVSSDGLGSVVAEVAVHARPEAVWTIATKGWDPKTLRTPSEVLASAADEARVAVLAGPALAPELVAGAPTAMVVASTDEPAALEVAATLASAGVSTAVTDDVPGAEVAAAYKNVTAIAVGMSEGLSERLAERVYVHRYANARAAIFAQGLHDASRLALAKGGRLETALGLAGSGDLYVTCLGGRNGTFGRLVGAGESAEHAQRTIGSTVEGIGAARAALAVADRMGVDLAVARAVDAVLTGETAAEEAVAQLVASVARL